MRNNTKWKTSKWKLLNWFNTEQVVTHSPIYDDDDDDDDDRDRHRHRHRHVYLSKEQYNRSKVQTTVDRTSQATMSGFLEHVINSPQTRCRSAKQVGLQISSERRSVAVRRVAGLVNCSRWLGLRPRNSSSLAWSLSLVRVVTSCERTEDVSYRR